MLQGMLLAASTKAARAASGLADTSPSVRPNASPAARARSPYLPERIEPRVPGVGLLVGARMILARPLAPLAIAVEPTEDGKRSSKRFALLELRLTPEAALIDLDAFSDSANSPCSCFNSRSRAGSDTDSSSAIRAIGQSARFQLTLPRGERHHQRLRRAFR